METRTFSVQTIEVSGAAYNGPAYNVLRSDGFVWRTMRFYEDAVFWADWANKKREAINRGQK